MSGGRAVKSEEGFHNYTHILAAASAQGKNVLPRLGAVLDVQPLSGIPYCSSILFSQD